MTVVPILGFVSGSAQAGQITGAIEFSGFVTCYEGTNGTGTGTTEYTQAHSVVFENPIVSSTGKSGSFAGISNSTPVSMTSPLAVNPPVAPAGALWTVSNISFHAFSISTVELTESIMKIEGFGIFTDGTPADTALGTWTAVFDDFECLSLSEVTDPPPSLSITTDGTNAIMSWPTNSISLTFSVQATTNAVVPANWTTLTNTPVLVGNRMVVTNPLSGDLQLFRMVH